MNTELSPRIRTLVSSLTAIAITTLLATTLAESFNPVARQGSAQLSAPVNAATTDIRSHTAFIRTA